MKKEGRQQQGGGGGVMVKKSYAVLPPRWNHRSDREFPQGGGVGWVNRAGANGRVSSRPSENSKFTGYCGRLSKDKGKGGHKVRDVGMDCRMLAWKVVDQRGKGVTYSGVSAKDVLGHLANGYDYDYDYDEEEDVEVEDHHVGYVGYEGYGRDLGSGSSIGVVVVDQLQVAVVDPHQVVVEEVDEEVGNESGGDDGGEEEEDSDDSDRMSFCDVGFVIEEVEGDEDWWMVGEL